MPLAMIDMIETPKELEELVAAELDRFQIVEKNFLYQYLVMPA